MACGLALLASGQVFATNFYSATATILDADLANDNKWASNCGGTPGGLGTPLAGSDLLAVCPGHSLNLTTAVTVNAGALTFTSGTPGGTWGGTGLKFGAGNKVITNNNSPSPSIALDVSSMSTGNQITITFNNSITFSSVTGGSLACPSSLYTAGNSLNGVTCTVTVGGGGGGGAVSAPIFSTKEKPAVFSEEVK